MKITAISMTAFTVSMASSLYVAYSVAASHNTRSYSRQRGSGPLYEAYLRNREAARHLSEQGDMAWHKDNDVAKAEALYKKSLALDPTDVYCQLALARVFDAQGRESEALQAYRKIVHPPANSFSTYQQDPAILLRYSVLSAKNGEWQESVSAYREAAPQLSRNTAVQEPSGTKSQQIAYLEAVAHLAKGLDYQKYGSLTSDEQAIGEFSIAIKIKPDFAPAYFQLGQSLKTVGRQAEAQRAFRQATKFGTGQLKNWAEHQAAEP